MGNSAKSTRTFTEFLPEFCSNRFDPHQKEAVFNALLKNYLVARGYVVAKPEPDLGDDVWFVEREEVNVRRGQVKSAHSCYFDGDASSHRRYCVKLQLATLRAWVKQRDYVYFFAIADDQFHGLGEGAIEGSDSTSILHIESSRVIKSLPNRDFVGIDDAKDKNRVKYKYRASTRGFHFGCVPCRFFGTKTDGWTGSEKSLWFVVELVQKVPELSFRYWLGQRNVTAFFGQAVRGLTIG